MGAVLVLWGCRAGLGGGGVNGRGGGALVFRGGHRDNGDDGEYGAGQYGQKNSPRGGDDGVRIRMAARST